MDGLRILCCGGDGTCCWVLSVLDDMGWPAPYPPIAVLPLGTGNDLSRALGWGPGYRDEPLSPFLNLLTKDTTRSLDLDRWKVWYVPASVAGGGGPKGPQELNDEMKASEETSHITMNNYWSIGVDAKVALDFHRKREDNPQVKYFEGSRRGDQQTTNLNLMNLLSLELTFLPNLPLPTVL